MFPVIDVSNWERLSTEQMGTKPKFWCQNEHKEEYLFKESRPHAGEHWSEKIAAEIAELLGLPHAEIELAECGGKRGTLSRKFLPLNKTCSLVHGNELLFELDNQYPKTAANFRVVQHTLNRIFEALENCDARIPEGLDCPSPVSSGCELFVGYLLLDALISNTDRHHENWAITICSTSDGSQLVELAPTFDHASSLGRELTDKRREAKYIAELKRHDPNAPARRDQTIVGYLESEKGRSRIYCSEDDAKPLHPMNVFKNALQRYPEAGKAWIDRLSDLELREIESLLTQVPKNLMSESARNFSLKMLELNIQALINQEF